MSNKKDLDNKPDQIEDCQYGYSNENSGVYMITNIKTGKHYIGETNRLDKRFQEHCSWLRNDKHYNKSFQEDFNRYMKRECILEYKILAKCPPFLTKRLESIYISHFNKEDLYIKGSMINNDFIYYLEDNQKWVNSLKSKYRIILKTYFDWYCNNFNNGIKNKKLFTALLNEGIEEAKDGNLLKEYVYLNRNFHKNDDLFDNTLDYVALAIIKKIKENEDNKIICDKRYRYPENHMLYKCGLVDGTIKILREDLNELPFLMRVCFHFGCEYSEKYKYYNDKLEMIELLDSKFNPKNLLDCLYEYYIIIFLNNSMMSYETF